MKRTGILSLILLTMALPALGQHSGRIFVDRNQNGVFDAGEKALKNVSVSDGLNVVKSDKNGQFTLPGHPGERFIFITTPSGYLTKNEHYLPVKPTTESYDFALIPYNAGIANDGSHQFLQVTDSEIFNTENNERWVADLRAYANNEKAAFIIHTGDICYEKGLKAHIGLMNTDNMGVPVFYCIGNHDLVKGKYGEEVFEKYYGPVYYSFNVAGVHYIVNPMPGGDYRPGYTCDEVARWMKNDLAQIKEGTPVYIFNHNILTSGDRFIYKGDTESIDLDAYNLKAWIYGHWHINLKQKQGNVWTICTSSTDKGGIDHSKGGYRVIKVDGNGDFSSQLRYCYLNRHLCITSPTEMSATTTLTVNAYSSISPIQQVTYTCKDGNLTLWKNKALEQKTDWTWTAEMPLTDKLIGKELTLEVTSLQKNGETATATRTFTYMPHEPAINLDADWDNLLGNASHTGGISSAKLDSTLTLGWVTNVGANLYMTSPLIHQGKIYVASVDEDAKGQAHVYALDALTGKMIWKYPVRASVKNSIAIADGKVFAQDILGHLYALNTETGALEWEAKLPISTPPGLIEGLTATDRIVYAGSGKALSAFDAASGKLLWRNDAWNRREGTTSTLSANDDVVIGSVQWSALYANDAHNGKLLWARSDSGLRNRGASAAIHGNLIYIISEKAFFILDAQTGRTIVRKDLEYSVDVTSTPLLTDREIIFGTAQRGLVALDNQTLEELWNCEVGDALIYTAPYTRPVSATIETSPILAGNLVWVAASDGCIYGIDKRQGQIKWKHATGAPAFGSVAASGNALVATDFGGNVYLFHTSK